MQHSIEAELPFVSTGPKYGHVVERRADQEAAGGAAGRACRCWQPDALLRLRSQRCPARRASRPGRLPRCL